MRGRIDFIRVPNNDNVVSNADCESTIKKKHLKVYIYI